MRFENMFPFIKVLWKFIKEETLYVNKENKNALDSCSQPKAEPVLVSQHKIFENIYCNAGFNEENSANQILENPNLDANGNYESHNNEKISDRTVKTEVTNDEEIAEKLGEPDKAEKSSEFSDIVSNFTAKDNGHAWIVLAAMFFSNTLTFGYVKSFGIIYNAIAEMHPGISVTMAGVMMGLLSGFKSILAPFAGALGNMIGIRLTMFLGTAVSCASLFAAYFCTSAIQYAIILGALTGISQCIIESCQVVIMSSYFEKRLSFANGIRVAGNPFGGVVYPLLLAALLEFYGLKLTFIMLAGVTAHLFICGTLVRPWNLHLKMESIKFITKHLDKRLLAEETSQTQQNEQHILKKRVQKKLFEEVMSTCSKQSSKKKKPLDFSYFLKPVYLLFILMSVGIPLACPLLYYYATIYAKNVLQLSVYEVSSLVAVQSVVDVCMRLGIGTLNNKKFYKLAHGYIFCLLLSGTGCLCIPLATGFWSLLCFTFIFSFGPNSYHTFINVILTNQFGKESIASTWGFCRMTQGIFAFIHPTLLGYIIDVSGGYTAAFITMGIGMIFAGVMILIEPLIIRATKSDIVIS